MPAAHGVPQFIMLVRCQTPRNLTPAAPSPTPATPCHSGPALPGTPELTSDWQGGERAPPHPASPCSAMPMQLLSCILFIFHPQTKRNRGDQATASVEAHPSVPGRDPPGLSLQLGRGRTRDMGLVPGALGEVFAASSARAVRTRLSLGQ